MTSTPNNPRTHSTRRAGFVGLSAVVAMCIGAAGCGGGDADTTSHHVAGYSYYHDSRINETPATLGYSYYHDSRINETPVTVDDSVNHDSHHDG